MCFAASNVPVTVKRRTVNRSTELKELSVFVRYALNISHRATFVVVKIQNILFHTNCVGIYYDVYAWKMLHA
jgi:hypothetical protein